MTPEPFNAAHLDIRPLLSRSGEARACVTDVTHVTPYEGGALLDDIRAFIRSYVVMPDEHCEVATALWVVHTYLLDHLDHTPRLAYMSPEPGSGKSRALEVLELLCLRPILALNISASALCRMVSDEDARPTVLFDEIDGVFGGKNAANHEDLRVMLNGGYRRGASVIRVADPAHNTLNNFGTFAAVAVAGLHSLPDTVASRSIIIAMRRRRPSDRVASFRRREAEPGAQALRDRISMALSEVHDVTLPVDLAELGIRDRDADVWEPLIAVADLLDATGWGRDARRAAVAFIEGREPTITRGTRLLLDIRGAFDRSQKDRMSTSDLIHDLCQLEESPWAGDGRWVQITAREVADLLRPYGISPVQMRWPDRPNARGYRRVDFEDSWERYL